MAANDPRVLNSIKERQTQKSLHTKVKETMFGDVSMSLWQDPSGQYYVKMRRGLPETKTFCIEHFNQFVEQAVELARFIQRLGE